MPDVVDQGDGQRYGGCPQQLVEVDVEVVRVEVELRVVHVLQLGDDEEVGGEADDDKEVGGDVRDGLLLELGQGEALAGIKVIKLLSFRVRKCRSQHPLEGITILLRI